MGVTTVRS